ncbi:MAG: Ubiquinone biosynthesis protein coq9, mitochondrial [Piccolia ochrophora]|nr:MAG: Ubiquinone biosynthesis protein coq9, mitochondrial [Piccolia ochrophora]
MHALRGNIPCSRYLCALKSSGIRPSRSYHSYERPNPAPPFGPTEDAILSSSLRHVPKHGFTETSLSMGARDAGYLDVSINLFPSGAFDLIKYHLVTQRLALAERARVATERPRDNGGGELSVAAKIRLLAVERLKANGPIIDRWQEALAIMAQPRNVPASAVELARLSDEILFLSGDTSVDTSWYTKRASLSAVYSSSELYMTQDKSVAFGETQKFLDRRLNDATSLGAAMSDIGGWVSFTGHAFTNVLRSKGVRI